MDCSCRDGNVVQVYGMHRKAGLNGSYRDKRLESNPLDYLFSDIAASADGERIALGAASGKIHIFNARSTGQDGFSLKLEKSLDPIDKTPIHLHTRSYSTRRNHDRLLAAYMPSPYMALWKIDENVHSTFGDEEAGPVWRVAFDPEGEFVASATNDAVVRLWTSPDTDSAVQLRGHLGSVLARRYQPRKRNYRFCVF